MAHDVKFMLPERPLGRSDVEFTIKRDGAALGYLKISKGAAVWRPAHTRKQFRIGWSQLADLFIEEGKQI